MEITNYIKEDLSARLRSGQELPVALTIDALSEHYQVSFTPVRTAIAELINEGLVIKGPNRRLIAAQVPKGLGQPIPQPEFPPDKFSLVLNDLVQLSLRGQAIILREEVTAEKYGISRSAIRSILHRLAGEGVLDHLPRKGWRLRPFLQADLQAFIEVREVLEIKALELAQLKLDPIVLQQMLAANHLPTSEDLEPRIDESLHEYLVAQSRNSYIRDFFDRKITIRM
jgi:DNA-binding GntR family transcriptional regulator